MIDLTPLEVRKKKGDFRRAMRGYDPALVDDFLDLVADRLEELVRDNMALHERVTRQDEQVKDYRDRERALTEALVSAQEMREEVRKQASREAELAKRAAEQQAEQLRASAQEEVRQLRSTAQQQAAQELASLRQEREREEQLVRELRARREEFVGSYRALLEQQLEELGVMARAAGMPSRRAAARQSTVAPAPEPPAAAEAEPERYSASDAQAGAPSSEVVAVPGVAAVPAASGTPSSYEADEPDELDEGDVAEEAAFALGADPAEVDTDADEILDLADASDTGIGGEGDVADIGVDEEPFSPEPFVDEEADAVVEAWAAEAGPAPAADGVDRTEVTGDDGSETRLYDGVAPDQDGDGVPGPIGLGQDPWSAPPEWSISDLELVDGPATGDALDLDLDDEDEDDEEMQRLLRNAAAAGYRLDEPAADELLLEEAVPEDDEEPDEPADDGWLPTLLEDDK